MYGLQAELGLLPKFYASSTSQSNSCRRVPGGTCDTSTRNGSQHNPCLSNCPSAALKCFFYPLTSSIAAQLESGTKVTNWLLTPRPSRDQGESCCTRYEGSERDREQPSFDEECGEGGKGS